ncbi:AAA domain-containing protein [Segatella copri]|jgi:DNA replication ATP-dependent helicase Dna2|uniref:AAA domain-containing protein n=1 Tax=Segatella copri TaxID=165179 RepID=UPI001C476903|nr:AAA domain-containing protein [Segatella copri]MBW0025614.1 AAA family ATPase [Segatella copri]
MIINRRKHWQFLEDELKAETEDFKKIYLATAISLLKISQEMYVAQFISFKDGEMIMQFPISRALPRKGDFLVCMVLPPELQDYRNWGDRSYRDLYKARYNSTECVCIWHSPANDPRYSLVGFSKVSVDFANYIKKTPNIVLTFAPQRPPIDYVMNLQKVVEDQYSKGVASILDANYQAKDWEPIPIRQDDVSGFVYSQMALTETMILEGPPGTGKTYMIAELCAKLCAEGHSVLVTALTNRALMEIAEKPAVESLLGEHRIFKTNISMDEIRELSKLETLKSIAPMPGCLVMSTFYITSGYAAELTIEQPFDYVIMDEASQAIFPMFAASRKIGKRNLWVGDIHQLSPIVILNGNRITIGGYKHLIEGLKLLADNSISPIYQLATAYRFGQRAANYTGVFYNDSLVAKESPKYNDLPSMFKILSKDGGPTLVLTDMPSGDCTPQFAIYIATFIVDNIVKDNKDKEIAVLTCMKKTTRALQMAITQKVRTRKNLLVDTVARVQGLTTDITIFFVPDYSYIRTLEPHLFNVATSRAREHTIIIADKYVLDSTILDTKVRRFLERLKQDKCIYVPDPDHRFGKSNKVLDYQKSIGSTLFLD